MYSLLVFLVGDVILGIFADMLLLGVAYIFTGAEALVVLCVMLKNIIKEKAN